MQQRPELSITKKNVPFYFARRKYQNGKTKLRHSKALSARIMGTKVILFSDLSGGGLSGRALFNDSKELGSNPDWSYGIYFFFSTQSFT